MRAIFHFLFLLLAACGAAAQTPQDKAYVAARERLVGELEARRRSLTPPIDESAWNRDEARGQAALMAQLTALIGPETLPKGFSGDRSDPDPVCCARGAGSLDALVIFNGRIRAVMTTEGIARLWLGREPVAALRGDAVDYDKALNADAPVEVFAPLPVAAPTGTDLALARLVIKGEGTGRLPLHVVVAVVRKGRILLAMTPASLEAADARTPCETLWQEGVERYRIADDVDTRRAINLATGRQLEHCVRDHPGQALFPGLGRRAQKIVDALTAE